MSSDHGSISSQCEKQFASYTERVDSGVGESLRSHEFSSITEDFNVSPALRLHSSFSSLSIKDSEKTKEAAEDKCDSGLYSVEDNRISSPIRVAFPEVTQTHYDSELSWQELEELFSQDEDGDTHLHMSIIHLLPEVSLRIISMAPSHDLINIPNNLRQTPLHLAVATRQLIIVRRLMAAGAALDFPDHCGNTALHIACREGMLEMVQLLLRSVHYDETLMNAYEIPYQRIPQDLSLRNYDGYTCAHLALQNGHLHILHFLLTKGADVNEQDGKSGRTLLHMAADLGYGEAMDVLLRHRNLNLDARTYGGLTAVFLAHGRHLSDMVERLIRAGADSTQLLEDSGDSADEEMADCLYDDICINGQPVQLS